MRARWLMFAALLIAMPAMAGAPGSVSGVGPAVDLSPFVRQSQIPALVQQNAPVSTVNGSKGDVAVQPGPQIQRTAAPMAVSTVNGAVTWIFPTPFAKVPSCFLALGATSKDFTFDAPLVTDISVTSVSVAVSAHPKSLSIASLALPILLQITPNAPPVGTTVSFSCIAPAS